MRVPKDYKPEQLTSNNNLNGIWEKSNIRPHFTLRYGAGTRQEPPYVSWVIEVDPYTWKAATSRGKAYLDYQSCTVRDYTGVTRCYKCQRYGHVARACPKKDPVCGICAGAHDTRKCKRETTRCVHCQRAGKNNKHHAGSQQCEAHARAIASAWCATDHGDTVDTSTVHKNPTVQSKLDIDLGDMDTQIQEGTMVFAEQ